MKIEAGKCYRTRDGQKVGPMRLWEYDEDLNYWWEGRDGLWKSDGSPRFNGAADGPELIAEWRDEPDLTTITTQFGLLDGKTQEALKAHGGPYEWLDSGCEWKAVDRPLWRGNLTYRVKPVPPKPREWWLIMRGEKFQRLSYGPNTATYGDEQIIHVREVLPDQL